MEPKLLNRKAFLCQAGLLLGAVVAAPQVSHACLGIPISPASSAGAPETRPPVYRIAGLPDQTYSPGFHKLCRYGRFASVREAIASVHNPRTEFLVVCD